MEAHDSEAAPHQQSEAAPPTEAAPPALNDAIQALHAQQAEILREVRGEPEGEGPAEEYQGEEGEGEEPFEQPAWDEIPDEMSEGDLRTAMREEALAAVRPYALHTERRALAQENRRREEAIRALPQKYPELEKPEVVGAVADILRELAHRANDPSIQTDPVFVERAYMSWAAEQAHAGETPVGEAGRGATLESGAGPGLQEQEVDPVQAQYERAILGEPGRDVLTS